MKINFWFCCYSLRQYDTEVARTQRGWLHSVIREVCAGHRAQGTEAESWACNGPAVRMSGHPREVGHWRSSLWKMSWVFNANQNGDRASPRSASLGLELNWDKQIFHRLTSCHFHLAFAFCNFTWQKISFFMDSASYPLIFGFPHKQIILERRASPLWVWHHLAKVACCRCFPVIHPWSSTSTA